MDLLTTKQFKCSVSSVLNKDVKQNGKQYLYDGKADTAWTSNEGTPQWIRVEFAEIVTFSKFRLQFQGGFAAQEIQILINELPTSIATATSTTTVPSLGKSTEERFYPADSNAEQNFQLSVSQNAVKTVKLIFLQPTDFFGRIILYKLELIE